MVERNEYECPTGDGPEAEGLHVFRLVEGEECAYECTECGLKIPAEMLPVKNELGKVLRNPMNNAVVMAAQPAEEAFSDYVMAMNGGW